MEIIHGFRNRSWYNKAFQTKFTLRPLMKGAPDDFKTGYNQY